MALTRTRPPGASTGTTGTTTAISAPDHTLRANALGFPTVLAESIGVISPTMTAVLIIPIAFSYAGQGTWVTYAFGTVMLMFVRLLPQPIRQADQRCRLYVRIYGSWPRADHGRVLRLVPDLVLPLHRYRRADGFCDICPTVPRRDRRGLYGSTDIAVPHQCCRVLVRRLQGHPCLVRTHPRDRGVVGCLHRCPGVHNPFQARPYGRYRSAQS